MMLAQTEHEVRGYKRTAQANALQGVKTEFIAPPASRSSCPIINIDGPRYPSSARCGRRAAARRGTTRWPGAMRGPARTWAWTSSSNAR